MGGACSMNSRNEKWIENFSCKDNILIENLKGRDQLEDLDMGG
jgi:hypothetical protein